MYRVDLLVGDIYGTDYSRIGLSADVIASRFLLDTLT
jgi:pantothenate kinase